MFTTKQTGPDLGEEGCFTAFVEYHTGFQSLISGHCLASHAAFKGLKGCLAGSVGRACDS